MNDDNKARLAEIDEDLARLRNELTPPPDEPQDYGDAGQDLNARGELQAQIDVLEQERERLLNQGG
ncbi:hypothetical protein [Actinomadura macrotermitis]|uniref:Uncharacterized protein n=1 Tax=Actinomadura macrotermitis TaxID=2585200 RepID=A0A7K0BS11_9ACTN|nr:hypothetical protein [Actinomadura macrotermitis]MQY03983.1 hypothetical protein [Actinomadura macrotermitis]